MYIEGGGMQVRFIQAFHTPGVLVFSIVLCFCFVYIPGKKTVHVYANRQANDQY